MIHFLYNYDLTHKRTRQISRLNRWLHWQLHKYLKVHLVKYYKKIDMDSLQVDISSNVIVSLTSFPARIDLVYITIRSILNQTQRPQKIVLWLGDEQFPFREKTLPKSLLDLKSAGLEIEFCEDIKAHKKYFFAFQKYPDNLIVTVDDDVIYPRNFLNILFKSHREYPDCIIANRVRYMELENMSFKPYREWTINRVGRTKGPSKNIFSTGVGGVLYQPKFFQKSFFDLEGIRKTKCINDDIWLKAGQIKNNIPVFFTNIYYKQFIEIPESQNESLFKTNVFESDNDRQIKEVFEYFGIYEKDFE